IDEVVEQLLALEGDDGNALEVGAQQPLIGRDVPLAELEAELGLQGAQLAHRLLAEMAVGLRIDRDRAHRSLLTVPVPPWRRRPGSGTPDRPAARRSAPRSRSWPRCRCTGRARGCARSRPARARAGATPRSPPRRRRPPDG